MYQLDLATLLHLLAGQTGTLSTSRVTVPGLEYAAQVLVRVVAGQVAECRVVSQGQVRLHGHEALEAVLALDACAWEYQPDVPRPSPDYPSALAHTAALVPQRSRMVPLRELALWPRRQRVLYQLTDGTHSIEQLAYLLSQRMEVIATALLELEQQYGAIRLSAPRQQRQVARTRWHVAISRKDALSL